MLAVLRVAPLLPSPTLRAVVGGCQVGTGKLVHWSNWKAEFGLTLTGRAPRSCDYPSPLPVMHFYSGPPMHLLSGVDTQGFANCDGRPILGSEDSRR